MQLDLADELRRLALMLQIGGAGTDAARWADRLLRVFQFSQMINEASGLQKVDFTDPELGIPRTRYEEVRPPNLLLRQALRFARRILQEATGFRSETMPFSFPLQPREMPIPHGALLPQPRSHQTIAAELLRAAQALSASGMSSANTGAKVESKAQTSPDTPNHEPAWLTVSEAAKVSGMTASQVSKAASQAKFVCKGTRRQRRIDSVTFVQFLLEQSRPQGEESDDAVLRKLNAAGAT